MHSGLSACLINKGPWFHLSSSLSNEPRHEKTWLIPNVNNKGADQPAHPRSLISTFVVHCLDSIIPVLAKSKISGLYLASVAGQFESYLVANHRRQVFS